MRRKAAQMRFNGIWAQAIVCVQENDVFSGTGAEPGITRRSTASIFLPDATHMRVRGNYIDYIVRGTVIYNNDFDWSMRLRERARDGVRQIMCLVVAGNYDRDEWHLEFIHRWIPAAPVIELI
jgi:hypothetical protein